MNKTEMIKEISVRTEIKRVEAKKALNAVVDIIKEEVSKNWEIRMSGIGTFKKVHKDARTARNPKTGDTIKVPAKNTVKVRIAKDFKEAVNK